MNFDMKHINTNNIYDFGLKKLTPSLLNFYN